MPLTSARTYFLWGMLLLYASARVCQLYADRLPALLIVVLHVVPPALFALMHGAVIYRIRGIAAFAGLCLGVGTLAESVSLRTGFPFGRYYFTDLMGPKILQLPVLLALAYLGIGYVAWILALLILGYSGKPIRGTSLITLPLLASLIMLSWDFAMDPDWSTLDHAWIWRQGGAWFGVPLTNFLGWFLTAYLYYQAFALYCWAKSISPPRIQRSLWLTAILLYAVCAFGNPLILLLPMAPPVVTDAAGKQWLTKYILETCTFVSLLLMAPFALLAWLKLRKYPANASTTPKPEEPAHPSSVQNESSFPLAARP